MTKPHRVEVLNQVNGKSFGANFDTKEEADSWIQSCISKNSWGKPEREINAEDFPEELSERIIETRTIAASDVTPETVLHKVKADYVITQSNLNLSKTHRNQVKIDSRKAEYPGIEEIIHIILDHGFDSQEYADLQALRQSIKDKYVLE